MADSLDLDPNGRLLYDEDWQLVKTYKLPVGKKARKNKHSTNEKKRAAARR